MRMPEAGRLPTARRRRAAPSGSVGDAPSVHSSESPCPSRNAAPGGTLVVCHLLQHRNRHPCPALLPVGAPHDSESPRAVPHPPPPFPPPFPPGRHPHTRPNRATAGNTQEYRWARSAMRSIGTAPASAASSCPWGASGVCDMHGGGVFGWYTWGQRDGPPVTSPRSSLHFVPACTSISESLSIPA